MHEFEGHEITELLKQWKAGDHDAFRKVIAIVYDKLHAIAHGKLVSEFGGSGLQTTELLNEAYESLNKKKDMTYQSRQHFFHTAGLAMHRFLIDEARKRKTQRHGGHLVKTKLEEEHGSFRVDSETVLSINDALEDLAEEDPQLAEIVKLRFFADYTIKETAEILGIPVIKVNRQWAFAKAWLIKRMKRD